MVSNSEETQGDFRLTYDVVSLQKQYPRIFNATKENKDLVMASFDWK